MSSITIRVDEERKGYRKVDDITETIVEVGVVLSKNKI